MDKSPDAFRTISEVADHLETPAHVLRFWESRFPQIRPVKRAGGRRYYRPSDVALLTGIKRLLHDEGLTIRGVQKILREQGVRHVAGLPDGPLPQDDLADIDTAPPVAPEVPAELMATPEPDPIPEPVPAQSGLPLFDTTPTPRPAPAPRDDVSFASRIRALPHRPFGKSRPEVAALVRRLVALRARMASQAEGGRG
jgi:DNA-binding transcriptional MerR regulator